MPAIHKLSDKQLKNAKPGKLFDGAGLTFCKSEAGSSNWVLRLTVNGRRREMGLGSYPDVGLAQARELARKARLDAKEGKDPILERQRARVADNTLADVFDAMFEVRKAELKNEGAISRWDGPVRLHVLPKLGGIPVTDLTQHDLARVLKPIWSAKAETASKALIRVGLALKHAAAMGLDVDMQLTDKARALLGKQQHTTKHIPAMPYQEVPAFYAKLGTTSCDLALRFLILTGLRSGAVRLAHRDQIKDGVWTVPAEHMKGQKGKTEDFRVPLCAEALRVVAMAGDGLLFPGVKGQPISDMTMSKRMRSMGLEYRPHGFRTSLRVWLAEQTDAPHEVAEITLAHVVDGAVVRAYRRTDYLEQRVALIDKWGAHVTHSADVVAING